ncbi:hypothetical protein [Paenibacillus tyrfis]|uniref:hypothetical protein n=1 Tax=Paenibacillus tyrfis TaxID=1501230 RepID=UPI000B58ED8C|nr:hypothetical protein [Paenibacillus tyrfis]
MEQQKSSRTRKLVALFVASTLVLGGTAGCSDSQNCADRNGDGYCDNGSSGSSGGHYYGGGGSGGSSSKASSDSSSGISKGGIGGSGSSSS